MRCLWILKQQFKLEVTQILCLLWQCYCKTQKQVFIQPSYLGYSSELYIFFQNEVLASIPQLVMPPLFHTSTIAKSRKIFMLCNPTEFKGTDMELWPATCSYLFHNINNLKCREIMWFTSHVWVCLYSKRTCCEHLLAPKITNQAKANKQTSPDGRVKASPAVPDIGNVGHPLEVCWDGVKADKKPREQQDWDGSNWAYKSCHLWREGTEWLLSEREKVKINLLFYDSQE